MEEYVNSDKQVLMMVDAADSGRLLAKEALGNAGCELDFKPVPVMDGEGLLNYLERLVEEDALPCVILMDTHMPGIDVFGVLQKIKSIPELNKIPVIMLLSEGDVQSDIERVYEAGADAYLTKSASSGSLCKRMRETVCEFA